jgi:hypothetical protein
MRYGFAIAIAAIGIGMVLVYAGVLGNGLIVPGALLIGAGMAVAAVAGIMSVIGADATHESPGRIPHE